MSPYVRQSYCHFSLSLFHRLKFIDILLIPNQNVHSICTLFATKKEIGHRLLCFLVLSFGNVDHKIFSKMALLDGLLPALITLIRIKLNLQLICTTQSANLMYIVSKKVLSLKMQYYLVGLLSFLLPVQVPIIK